MVGLSRVKLPNCQYLLSILSTEKGITRLLEKNIFFLWPFMHQDVEISKRV